MRFSRLAFTLIELLVTVGIIALLISILVPSLTKARDSARNAKCLANLKGISSASLTYSAEDLAENAVPVYARTIPFGYASERDTLFGGLVEWGGKSGVGDPLEDPTDPLTSHWGTARGRGPAVRPLNTVVFKGGLPNYETNPGDDQINWRHDTNMTADLYHCPSDRPYDGLQVTAWEDSEFSAYDFFGNSYAFPLCSLFTDGRFHSTGPPYHALSRIPSPGATLHYIEGCAVEIPVALYLVRGTEYCGEYDERYNPLNKNDGWHRREWTFNTSFADGHAESAVISDLILPAPRLPWYPPPAYQNRAGTYEEWQCRTIRGENWQLDILPTPPTPWYDYRKTP